jgi:hypothetical protein
MALRNASIKGSNATDNSTAKATDHESEMMAKKKSSLA